MREKTGKSRKKLQLKKKGFRGRLIDWSNWLDREIELLIADWDEREDEESLLFCGDWDKELEMVENWEKRQLVKDKKNKKFKKG